MSKPQVFTRNDIIACADEVIGMSGGFSDAFNDGVLALAGYLLDMQPEEVFDLMNGGGCDDECKLSAEERQKHEDINAMGRIDTNRMFAEDMLEKCKDLKPAINELCHEVKWMSDLATRLIREKYGIAK